MAQLVSTEQMLQSFLEQQSLIRDDSEQDRMLVLEELRALVMQLKKHKLRWSTLKILGEEGQAQKLYSEMELTIRAVAALIDQYGWLREVVQADDTLVALRE